jgi:hypothetical protein
MKIGTGQTVYEEIMSLDIDNNPVTGVTFDTVMYRDGLADTGVTVTMAVSDAARGAYSASWSADTLGSYQLYAKNNTTSVVFVANTIRVISDSELNATIYVGL